MIVLNTYRSNVTVQDVMENPLFQSLSAVQNKKVYAAMETSLVENPISSWYWYDVLAYPELFSDFDLRDRLREDYAYLYNIELSEEDIDNILVVEQNKDSANFEKFLSE